MPARRVLTVGADDEGVRLDRWLARRIPELSRARLQTLIEAGLVATGLTGAWVRTVQGLVFLVAVISYLYIEEPQRRSAFFARMRLGKGFGRAPAE